MLRVTIWRSDLSFTFSYSFSSLGSSAWQGPHQVAQTLMSTDLPSRFFNRHVLPARSANSKAGIVLVAFSQRPSANSCALAAGSVGAASVLPYGARFIKDVVLEPAMIRLRSLPPRVEGLLVKGQRVGFAAFERRQPCAIQPVARYHFDVVRRRPFDGGFHALRLLRLPRQLRGVQDQSRQRVVHINLLLLAILGVVRRKVVVAIDLAVYRRSLFSLPRQFYRALRLPFVVHQEVRCIEIIPRSWPLVNGALRDEGVQCAKAFLFGYVRVVGDGVEPIHVFQEPVFGELGNPTFGRRFGFGIVLGPDRGVLLIFGFLVGLLPALVDNVEGFLGTRKRLDDPGLHGGHRLGGSAALLVPVFQKGEPLGIGGRIHRFETLQVIGYLLAQGVVLLRGASPEFQAPQRRVVLQTFWLGLFGKARAQSGRHARLQFRAGGPAKNPLGGWVGRGRADGEERGGFFGRFLLVGQFAGRMGAGQRYGGPGETRRLGTGLFQ